MMQKRAERRLARLTAALLLAVPFIVIALSLRADMYVEEAAIVHRRMLGALQWVCWIGAAVLAVRPESRRLLIRSWVWAPGGASARRLPAVAVAAAVSFTTLLCFLKFCQYRGSQFDQDTAVMTQRAFSTLHGNWFHSSVYGVDYLSIHFALLLDLCSPVLLAWRSALPLLFIQCLAIGSMGLAVYALAARAGGVLDGIVGMMLVYACPACAQISTAALNDGAFLAPLLLWALVFWEQERPTLAAFFLALAAVTRELFPFSLAGLGLCAILKNGRARSSNPRAGAALLAAAVFLFLAESKLMTSFSPRISIDWYDELYRYKDFPGQGHREFLLFLLGHPLRTLWSMIYPFDRLRPALELVAHAGLFPLAAPAEFAAFGVAMIPQMLAVGGLHDMILHYPSLVFGLLMFATARGIAAVDRRLKNRGLEDWLIVFALLVCGFGLRESVSPLVRGFVPAAFHAAPGVAAEIPPDASLWVDEYFAAWAPARAQLKIMAAGESSFDIGDFSRGLFRPDFVLLQVGRLVQPNRALDPLLLYLVDNRYEIAVQSDGLILLRAPDPTPSGQSSPSTHLPVVTPQEERAFEDFDLRFARMLRGIPTPPVPPHSPDQKRIGDYLMHLLVA